MSTVGRALGLVLGLPLIVFAPTFSSELSPAAVRTLGVTIVVAIFWITEALPIAATSLLPVVLFPLLGIAKASDVAPSYMSPFVLLLLGGFLLAIAVERSGVHRRLALHLLRRIGVSARRLVLGFLVLSVLASMWISNTATALIALPIALAILDRARAVDPVRAGPFGAAVLLAIAYGASIGGMGTPVGTPPNLITIAAYDRAYPGGPPLDFASWMIRAVPVVLALVPLAYVLLTRVALRVPRGLDLAGREIVERELAGLGRWSAREVRALALFAATALLWITRADVPLGGSVVLPGWASALGLAGHVDDGTVALLMVVLAFALPAGDGAPLLTWRDAERAPWDLVLLFGGGTALSVAFVDTGLSRAAQAGLGQLEGGLGALFTPAVVFSATFLSEILSNTALANIVMPILADASRAMSLDPRSLLVAGGLACSCGFMLPAATGPNAIVFGTGRISVAEMAKAGLLLDLVGSALIAAAFSFG